MKRDLGAGADSALKSFRRRKILTLEEVAGLIGRTVHTARRRLQEWQAHHSYNQNGRYYTLPDVPEYDAHGLWRWRGVFFSRAGTLKQTVIELVGRSAAGMEAGELRELWGLTRVRSSRRLLITRSSDGRKHGGALFITLQIRSWVPGNGSSVAR